MQDIYKKVKKLDLSKWVITKFYNYTSSVRDRIASYETVFHEWGDPYLKELYNHFISIANLYYHGGEVRPGFGIEDNKTTIEITNIETGEKLYIGQYDCNYHLGKDVWSEFGRCYTFKTGNAVDNEKMK